MAKHKKTVAIYARVSTNDRQETENQLLQLREYCRKQGWTVFDEYVDRETGQTSDRARCKDLFLHAHQRKFDVVLFWALDRFSREGVRETLNHLSRLEEALSLFDGKSLSHLGPLRGRLKVGGVHTISSDFKYFRFAL